MTTKTAFTEDEWTVVSQAPTSAGMIVVTASSGGTFKETYALSKAYAAARAQHGKSELLDELVGSKPKMDKTHYHSTAELRENGLKHVRDGITLVASKATADEADDYRQFVLTLAHQVAMAHEEHGQAESPAEADAIEDIKAALGVTAG